MWLVKVEYHVDVETMIKVEDVLGEVTLVL